MAFKIYIVPLWNMKITVWDVFVSRPTTTATLLAFFFLFESCSGFGVLLLPEQGAMATTFNPRQRGSDWICSHGGLRVESNGLEVSLNKANVYIWRIPPVSLMTAFTLLRSKNTEKLAGKAFFFLFWVDSRPGVRFPPASLLPKLPTYSHSKCSVNSKRRESM